ncbi:unnamed protein product [Rotaria sordida]|uniref:Macro domain-containing protein n=1 Tax=Rotaria sordida TaxID=392033 RepID=A0A813R1S1_9BILA|nr:unnamed protein product [Rotaria sordida]CAF0828592.1 unnamed protein product [Rotaria sordida]
MTLTEDLVLTQAILTRYILAICMVLGIIGSLFDLIVFCQKKFRSNSCSVYFIATSIFNLLVILCGIIPALLASYQNYDIALYSSTFCKARGYIIHVLLMMSRSSVALACIDRFALCSRNAHIRRLNQYNIAILLVIIICILWLILPIHVLIYIDIQMPGRRCGGSGTYLIVYSIYAAIVTSIPLFIMIIFSFLAIQNLRLSYIRIHPNIVYTNENINRPIRMQKRDIQLMTIVISEVVIYFISTVWFPIYTIYLTITSNISKTTNRLAIEGFIRYLALQFLIFINSCSIFYIHLLASKPFRQECVNSQYDIYKKPKTLSEMSSREKQNKPSDSSQQQDNRFNRQDSQKPAISQQDRSSEENFDIIKYLHNNRDELMERYGYGKSSKRRYPRYYFINKKKSILIILQGDITRTKVDAIVNAANEHMTGGGGVDGIIHRAAGPELYTACVAHKKITQGVRLPTGHSRILLSYNMSSTTHYIINTAGPVYDRYRKEECAKELFSCYQTSLALANLYDLESIGFTAISCGIFGYPANQGADVALRTVDQEAGIVPVVVFVLWDDDIYDAWVRKAEELEFTSFDIENIKTKNPLTSSNDNDQIETKKNLNKNDDQPRSPTTFNPPVRDFSTHDKTPEDNTKSLLDRLPSVPSDTSDTQKTADMEEDDNSSNEKHPLHNQQTQDMTSVTQEEEKSTTKDHSEQKSVEETMDQHHNKQIKTNDDPSQLPVSKKTNNSHAEVAKNETAKDN